MCVYGRGEQFYRPEFTLRRGLVGLLFTWLRVPSTTKRVDIPSKRVYVPSKRVDVRSAWGRRVVVGVPSFQTGGHRLASTERRGDRSSDTFFLMEGPSENGDTYFKL